MSTLTKILIILLTISSIFLCGIVVTYVASSANYKQQYDDLRRENSSLKLSEQNAVDQMQSYQEEADRQKSELNSQISSLEDEVRTLESQISSLELARDEAERRTNNWSDITRNYSATNEQQAILLQDTLAENTDLKEELAETIAKLDETTNTLIQKDGTISQLQAESRRLLEEKTALQNRLDSSLQPAASTVTSASTNAAGAIEAVDINGRISALDLRNSTAEISVGSSAGVKNNMRFHVIRGEQFVCDIVIFDIDADKAAGTIELVQDTPRVGDTIKTNL